MPQRAGYSLPFSITVSVIAMSLLGGFVGATWTSVRDVRVIPLAPAGVDRFPAPWQVPAYPGMGGLRMAMIHDVLAERFHIRGPAYHEARIAAAQPRLLEEHRPWTMADMPDVDDVGVSLDRLGRSEEAVTWFERKRVHLGLPWPPPMPVVVPAQGDPYAAELTRIEAAGELPPERVQAYTTYANLGTVLAHAAMPAAMTGDASAQRRVEDALAALRAAVDINPGAHFGRERWQITLIEHQLACIRDATLALRFDGIGLSPPDQVRTPKQSLYGVSSAWHRLDTPMMTGNGRSLDDADLRAREAMLTIRDRSRLRAGIEEVYPDDAWLKAVNPTWPTPTPWDQPALGMIGLWTLGGGASPHLSQVLAGICERIGQRELAMEAWIRTDELAERISKDPEVVAAVRARAKHRLEALAESRGSSRMAEADIAEVRGRLTRERGWAEGLRTAYVAWERERIAANNGRIPDDLDAFWRDKPALASDPGDTDHLMIHRHARSTLHTGALPLAILGAGIGAWLGIFAWRGQRRRQPHGQERQPDSQQ